MSEWFEIVDENGRIIGRALRADCHGNPALVHRTAHVVVVSDTGDLLLQKRGADKDVQPGKWDTAVGGHLGIGETYEEAAAREMEEEIGLPAHLPLTHLFDTVIRNDIESENVRVFKLVCNGPFAPLESEIDELRFWTPEEVARTVGTGAFTPNLEREIAELAVRRELLLPLD